MQLKRAIAIAWIGVACCCDVTAGDWRSALPRPVFDERPELADLYDRAWEIAHERIDRQEGLPASRYMDEAHRRDRIWIWDTCFMVHFCKYLPKEFPGIESLDNFYELILSGEERPIPQVVVKNQEGESVTVDFLVHHADNPPLFAWTEYLYALQTGDKARLEKVFVEERWLQKWYERFDAFDPQGPVLRGVAAKVTAKKHSDGYFWSGCSSGMDNTPRGRTGEKDRGSVGKCPDNPDLLWIDALAQQGLSALYMERIARLLGRAEEARTWKSRYEAIRDKVNCLYWDAKDGFYYDIKASDHSFVKVATIASYWPLLAQMPTSDRSASLLEKLRDPKWFGGDIPLPSLARFDADHIPEGGYWRGALWLPTAYMTVKAVDDAGDFALARDLARRIVFDMYETWKSFEPHTIWECYSPTESKPSNYAKRAGYVRKDFCGWSALGPISLFIEDVIGVKSADAFSKTLVCDFPQKIRGRLGVENYRFGGIRLSVIATTEEIRVETDAPFTLRADGRNYAVNAGRNRWLRGK